MKENLRKYAKKLRESIVDKERLDLEIKCNLLDLDMLKNSKNILIYLSFGSEIDTYGIIEELFKMGKSVYVPKIVGSTLEFYLITSFKELEKGKFGIMEPTSKKILKYYQEACIILPGLMFDYNGNRIGYGGGYYDRFLEDKEIYKIGLCYECLFANSLETCEYDIAVDQVVTEKTKKLVR